MRIAIVPEVGDVAKAFHDSASVNEALRSLVDLTPYIGRESTFAGSEMGGPVEVATQGFGERWRRHIGLVQK